MTLYLLSMSINLNGGRPIASFCILLHPRQRSVASQEGRSWGKWCCRRNIVSTYRLFPEAWPQKIENRVVVGVYEQAFFSVKRKKGIENLMDYRYLSCFYIASRISKTCASLRVLWTSFQHFYRNTKVPISLTDSGLDTKEKFLTRNLPISINLRSRK